MNPLIIPIVSGASCLLAGIGIGHFVLNPAATSLSPEQKEALNQASQRSNRNFSSSSEENSISRRGSKNKDSNGKKYASVKEALAQGSQSSRMMALLEYFDSIPAGQFEEELAKLNSFKFGGERIFASMVLFSKWAEIDPQGALTASKKMGMGGMLARPTIMQSWAAKDPQGAANYYSANKDSRDGRGRGGPMDSASTIASEWAKTDSSAALKWAESLEGRDKSSAIAAVFSSMAVTDPANAAQMAATQITNSEDRMSAYRDIARQWAASDWTAAKAWVDTLSGEEKTSALSNALTGLSSSNPNLAAKEYQDNAINDPRLAGSIAQSLSNENPKQAAEFLLSQAAATENNEGRGGRIDRSMDQVMLNFTSQNDAAALKFAQELPKGTSRDTAISSYIETSSAASSTEKLALAASIENEAARTRSTTKTLVDYSRQDPEAAKAWLENTNSITAESKQQIQNFIDRRNNRRNDRGNGNNPPPPPMR